MRLRQRAAEHRKILGEDKRLAAGDGAPAGDDPVPRHLGVLHAELGRAVLDEHVEFLKAALVEQKLDALARGQFAAGMLRLDTLLAAAELGAGAPFFKGVQDIFHMLPPILKSDHFGGSNTAISEAETGIRPLASAGLRVQGVQETADNRGVNE